MHEQRGKNLLPLLLLPGGDDDDIDDDDGDDSSGDIFSLMRAINCEK